MFQPFSDDSQGECLNGLNRFVSRCAIEHYARDALDLGDPAAVVLALSLDS